jgi:hypothetical protein
MSRITALPKMVANEVSAASRPWPMRIKLDWGESRLGSDRDSTHSAEVDYAELLPSLFELQGGELFYRASRRTGSPASAEDDPKTPQTWATDIYWSRLAYRPTGRESRRNPRPNSGGSAIYSSRAAWNYG